jgi:hydrocephalus-inducing protein
MSNVVYLIPYHQVGHLHGGCTKEFTLTFKSDKPIKYKEQEVLAKLTHITFDRPVNEVADWDDRLRCIKWVDATPPKPSSASSGT